MYKTTELDPTQKIFGHLEKKPFSLKRWINNNLPGILGTIIFHLSLLILFLIIKINSLQEKHELGITIDFTQQQSEDKIPTKEKTELTPAEAAYLERMLSQQANASNFASNLAEKLDKEISTRNYVDQVEKELDQSRSEEWRKQQEEIQKKLNQKDYIPENKVQPRETEIDDYKGPTNITYEFLEPPVNRYKIYLPVPVYKCQGEGTVNVDILVDQSGRVISSKAFVQQDFPDKDCIKSVAEKYALRTRFEGNLNAPKTQRGRIVYKFIAQ